MTPGGCAGCLVAAVGCGLALWVVASGWNSILAACLAGVGLVLGIAAAGWIDTQPHAKDRRVAPQQSPDRRGDSGTMASTQAVVTGYEVPSHPTRAPRPRQQASRPPLAQPLCRSAEEETRTEALRKREEGEEDARDRAAEAAAQAKQVRFVAYLNAEEAMNELYSQRQLPDALAAALRAMALLPEQVREAWDGVKDSRPAGALPGPWPPVTMVLLLAPILGDQSALDHIAALVRESPVTAHWMPLVDSAREGLQTVRRILDFVESNPGCLQEQLPWLLSLDQRTIQHHCYWLAEAGSLGRIKAGRSYELYAA